MDGAPEGSGADSEVSFGVHPASKQAVLSPEGSQTVGTATTSKDPLEPEPESAKVASGSRDLHPDVLVVEDDDDEVAIISRAIRRHGLASRFKIVRSGEDALAYLAGTNESDDSGRPKVVLLDLKLGGIDGHEVLRRIRASEVTCTIPVVILSSSRSSDDLCKCYRLGANSFVTKPTRAEHPGEHVLEIARYWLELNRPATYP